MIFKDQTGVRLQLRCFIDFVDNPLSSAKVAYIKPDNTEAQWAAQILPGTDGDIYVDFSDTTKFDQAGLWKLWAEVVYADSRTGIGSKQMYWVED